MLAIVCTCTARIAWPTRAIAASVLTPAEAEAQVGSEVTVEGFVEREVCSSQACVLSFGPAFSGLVVSIPAAIASSRAQDGYEGRTVRVRGLVEAPQGRPRIEVHDPADVERLDLHVGVQASHVETRSESESGAPAAGAPGSRSVSVRGAEPAGPSVAEITRALEAEGEARRPPGSTAGVDALAERVSALEDRAGQSAALPPGLLPLTDGPVVTQRPDEVATLHEELGAIDERLAALLDGLSHLEQRIAVLEQAAQVAAAAPPPTVPSYVVSGSRRPTLNRVRRGWSADRVLRTVGEPQQVVSRGEGAAIWHYGGGRSVTVDERGRVTAASGF